MRIDLAVTAATQLKALEEDPSQARVLKAVRKTLGLMQVNLRHPSLQTHKFNSLTGPNGEEVFEAYAQNRTAAAWRIFWHYGPGKDVVTVIAITAHP